MGSRLSIALSFLITGAQPLLRKRFASITLGKARRHIVCSPRGKTLLVDSGKNGRGSKIQAVMMTAGSVR